MGAIDFAGTRFEAGTPLDATCKFNSYRVTWRTPVVRSERLALKLGATAKVRDALVELHAGDRILEGGADNDEVYSFALLHYAVAGVTVTL
jgi:hypothetical protein